MITINFIKENSKPHRIGRGRALALYNEKYELSIVGGAPGLYGDFEEDFEIAIIDPQTRDFITKIFYPSINDDVIAYMEADDVVEIANRLFRKSFQVR